ncbi:hypothetical protein [Sphingobium phenoxybenzoativorans]|uniref:hypothetical protein n=1 Tax=Sphingobium phenoxybenzoativorans TaxID=1592790 RepID=UPI000872BAC4|nr:hypothetical protein [Sphingobium phenoxybenzoativorans]
MVRGRWKYGVALAAALMVTACNSTERTVLDETANGLADNAAGQRDIDRSVKAEAQAIMAPLAPPEPGTPGGLPDEPVPLTEGTIDPESPQGAAQLVQGYYGLLEEKRFGDAQKLWGEGSDHARQDPAAFARRFAGFSEIHANIGAPADSEGAAGSLFVTVPVQVYARIAADGKPWYALRSVTLRRVNDVDGSSPAQRSWHIESIGPFPPPAP